MNIYDDDEEGGFSHPLGGYDVKKMAEQLAAVMDLATETAMALQTLKVQIENMELIQAPPAGAWLPRNRRFTA